MDISSEQMALAVGTRLGRVDARRPSPPSEIANAPHSRGFRSPAILEFFNTNGTKRTSGNVPLSGVKQTSRRKGATSGFDPSRHQQSIVCWPWRDLGC